MAPLRVAIIGSGASGLPAIRNALQYGVVPVVFEKSDDIGGLWRYKPNECDGKLLNNCWCSIRSCRIVGDEIDCY
jgi:cation diffusion facilitator CzcD-associated flavoprotein CzcO